MDSRFTYLMDVFFFKGMLSPQNFINSIIIDWKASLDNILKMEKIIIKKTLKDKTLIKTTSINFYTIKVYENIAYTSIFLCISKVKI